MLTIVLTYLLEENALNGAEFAWLWVASSVVANVACLAVFIFMCTRVFALGAVAAPLERTYGDIFSTKADPTAPDESGERVR
jgi:hypothetical protein